VIDITFDAEEGPKGLSKALDRICEQACRAAQESYQFIVLSDRKVGIDRYLIILQTCKTISHRRVA
jgi:hypothetical protein